MARSHSSAGFEWKGMGHEKEPVQPHGGHDRHGRPLVHSHSHRPKRSIRGTSIKPVTHGKRGRKHSM